jgi:uncharacterized alpha-E superfamily protein
MTAINTPIQSPTNVPVLDSPDSGVLQPVLARDADATYWMSRYVERSEHIARLMVVNSEVLLDVGDLADDLLHRHWESVLQIMNVYDLPDGPEPLPLRVAKHMTFNQDNPNSLIRCVTRARENARGIREVISTEMWQHLNIIYWAIRADEAQVAFAETPDQLYQQIITGSMLFQGLTDQTLLHGQRWYFTQLGKNFERIMVTCRILQSKYDILRNSDMEEETPLWNIHWLAVLRSCGSLEAYRRTYLGELDPAHVAQFLVLESSFPRSVRYCVREALTAITAIRSLVRPRSVDPTERILGRLDAQLEYAEPSDLMADDLSKYLGRILDAISEAALTVQRSFFLH